VKLIFNPNLVHAANNEQTGRMVVLNFLRACFLSEDELDAQLERLHIFYTDMIKQGKPYPTEFARGALMLIEEIDSNNGILPEE
jgi:hypothetical protein